MDGWVGGGIYPMIELARGKFARMCAAWSLLAVALLPKLCCCNRSHHHTKNRPCHLGDYVRSANSTGLATPELQIFAAARPGPPAQPQSPIVQVPKPNSKLAQNTNLLGPAKNQGICTGPTMLDRTGPESWRIFLFHPTMG